MAQLTEAGVPVTLLFSPVIPGLNDRDLEGIVEAAAAAGAESAAWMLLRLPLEIRDLFHEWLHEHYPMKASKVIALVRQCRGGADNDARFGYRMRGEGPVADLINIRFTVACRKHGLNEGERYGGRTDLFTPPVGNGRQGDLFA